MKARIIDVLSAALATAQDEGILASRAYPPAATLDRPRERSHGDLASNLALVLAKPEGQSPRAIAALLVARLVDPGGWFENVEIAGPGFLNFKLTPAFWHEELAAFDADPALRIVPGATPRRVQVEFVSANPTGPLTVGHGRNAVLGDTVARILEAAGQTVEREYYFNNAGRQMQVLGASVEARYREACGRGGAFPEDGYQGEYIREIARNLASAHGDALLEDAGPVFRDAAEKAIFADIRRTLDRLAIRFDRYFNEDTLYSGGAVERTLADLEGRGLVERREGAVWLRGDAVGLEKDRVLVKSSGEPAYRLPDIAYHRDKISRGYDEIVDVLGADHIDESREVRAALAALGDAAGRIRPVIYQFVTLTRHGVQVKMSTRRAEYVTLDELVDEVGVDAVRFFFLARKSDTHLEFDLELAKQQSTDNPVYYVQYAHARISNLFGRLEREGIALPAVAAAAADLAALVEAGEFELLRAVVDWPETVLGAAADLEPHRIVFHLQELAATLHRFYNQHRLLGDERAERLRARLVLLRVVQRVLRHGLGLLGVGAPERM